MTADDLIAALQALPPEQRRRHLFDGLDDLVIAQNPFLQYRWPEMVALDAAQREYYVLKLLREYIRSDVEHEEPMDEGDREACLATNTIWVATWKTREPSGHSHEWMLAAPSLADLLTSMVNRP